ncbi:hypothetical protein ILYODFUR_035936 [Ilyodon furcidens]|uniref:Uncharacterized protein n=1 Tax=Ilyodon furcidens TaxID=33524 RepID=A0ABV0ST24_9TELE
MSLLRRVTGHCLRDRGEELGHPGEAHRAAAPTHREESAEAARSYVSDASPGRCFRHVPMGGGPGDGTAHAGGTMATYTLQLEVTQIRFFCPHATCIQTFYDSLKKNTDPIFSNVTQATWICCPKSKIYLIFSNVTCVCTARSHSSDLYVIDNSTNVTILGPATRKREEKQPPWRMWLSFFSIFLKILCC